MTDLILAPKDEGTWSSRLSVLDRERLRKVVKNVHLRHYPTEKVTDYEADKLINALGPVVGEQLIKQALDKGLL
jgi:glycerol kinase